MPQRKTSRGFSGPALDESSLVGSFDNPNKQLVDSVIVGQFGVESSGEQVALLYSDRAPVLESSDYVNAVAHAVHDRRSYEHGVERRAVDLRDLEVCLEAVHLTSERVSADIYVHQVERLRAMVGQRVRDDDHARACAPDRHTGRRLGFQGGAEAVDVYELNDGGTFTTRYDKPFHFVKLVR